MKPLTDEEWFAFWKTSPSVPGDSMYPDFLDIARAVEALVSEKLEAENKRLREALEYYADDNYNGHNGGSALAKAALKEQP